MINILKSDTYKNAVMTAAKELYIEKEKVMKEAITKELGDVDFTEEIIKRCELREMHMPDGTVKTMFLLDGKELIEFDQIKITELDKNDSGYNAKILQRYWILYD